MKTPAILFSLVLLFGMPGAHIHSQTAPVAKSPSVMLMELKQNNEVILEAQAATLKALEAMELEAKQLRIYSKRG